MGLRFLVLGGGSQEWAVALLGAHTTSKNRTRSHGNKHTSLAFIVVTFYELRFYGVLGTSWSRCRIVGLLEYKAT